MSISRRSGSRLTISRFSFSKPIGSERQSQQDGWPRKIHNDAPSAVTRLLDLGIEPYLASSSLLAVLAQRLVRQICRGCRTEIAITDAERKSLLLGNTLTSAYTGAGCDACRGTGYSGRLSISELLLVTEAIQSCIQQQDNAAQIRNAATADGFEPMRTDGIRKIAEGVTTVEEVLRVSAS